MESLWGGLCRDGGLPSDEVAWMKATLAKGGDRPPLPGPGPVVNITVKPVSHPQWNTSTSVPLCNRVATRCGMWLREVLEGAPRIEPRKGEVAVPDTHTSLCSASSLLAFTSRLEDVVIPSPLDPLDPAGVADPGEGDGTLIFAPMSVYAESRVLAGPASTFKTLLDVCGPATPVSHTCVATI